MKQLEYEKIKKLDFAQFGSSAGTENHHKIGFTKSVVASDGVIDMAKTLNCFWFLDTIVSYYPKFKHSEGLLSVYFILDNKGDSGIFYITDGDMNILIQQKINYTDCPKNLKVLIGLIDIEPSRFLIYTFAEH